VGTRARDELGIERCVDFEDEGGGGVRALYEVTTGQRRSYRTFGGSNGDEVQLKCPLYTGGDGGSELKFLSLRWLVGV